MTAVVAPSTHLSRRTPWIAGPALLVAWSIQSLLSFQPSVPPLLLVATVQLAAWAGFAWLWRHPNHHLAALGWAVGFRIVASLAQPLMEDDWARYLWDGWRFLSSGNPFQTAPAESFTDPTVPELLQRRLSEINNPHLPTIYGPTLQLGFALAAWIAPGELWPWKILTLAADLGILSLILRTFGSRAAALYGWCPLVIHETCVNAHADVLAILPLVAAWCALRQQRHAVAGFGLGLALAGKILALPAVPFLLGFKNPRGWLTLIITVTIAYAPFHLAPSPDSSLQIFTSEWEFNSALVGILGTTLPPFWARCIALALVAPFLTHHLWQCHRHPTTSPRIDRVFGGFLLASAVVNPWYLLWMVPFAAVTPSLTVWIAMPAVMLSYATALQLGFDAPGPYSHPAWLRPLEYGIIGAAALTEFLRQVRTGTSPTPPG
jgi:hypothetical protein